MRVRASWLVFVALASGCAQGSSSARCRSEEWLGECQLASITKVEDAEFPIPHVVLEAVYRPVANPSYPEFTPGALAKRTLVKSQYELPLSDYLEAHPRVHCRTEAPAGGACVAPTVAISLPEFDPQSAAASAAAPPVTGCAQIENSSTQDRLQGGQQTQTFVGQRIKFAENSWQLPSDADALTGEIAALLKSKPSIECLGIVGQIASGEPPGLAEQRAKAVRDLLGAHGVPLGQLLTIGATAKVFGAGSRPAEADPADRRVSFSVLLEKKNPMKRAAALALASFSIAISISGLAVTEPSAPPEMLAVPAGSFTMGADDVGEGDEQPAHAVTLGAFWLDRTEVTNHDYLACVHAQKCTPFRDNVARSFGAGPESGFREPNQPVVGVSFVDATQYCAFRGKRLPREAEWERAARGDDNRTFAWGNQKPTPELACYGHKPGAKGATTSPVGAHPAGIGPYGHLDLTGNVWEWTADLYDPYAYRRVSAPQGIPGSCDEILETQNHLRKTKQQGFTGHNPIPVECERVLRGGAFNYDAAGLRASNRVHHPQTWRMLVAGFRCAKDG